LFRQLWSKWKALAARIGNFQGRIILTVFYFVFVTPLGLAVRLFSDPLHIKRRPGGTFWQRKVQPDPSLDEARQQG
jgi:hypothetical protein